MGENKTEKLIYLTQIFATMRFFLSAAIISLQEFGNIKERGNTNTSVRHPRFGGVGRDRTGDTRIFSPLVYQLSYRTIIFP